MRRSITQRSALGLVLLGGLVFAVLGVRMLVREHRDRERQAARHTRSAVLRAKADAARLAQAPQARPAAEWRLEPMTIESARAATANPYLDPLRRAAGMERDPQRALVLYEALLHPEMPAWVRHTANLRKGLLLRGLGRAEEARACLEEAAQATSYLVDTTGTRVRARALAVLAEDGLLRGDRAPLRTFLEAAEGGVRLVVGGRGPAQELVALARGVREGRVPDPPGEAGARLREGAAHAETGLRLLRAVPAEGTQVVGEDLVWRQGGRLMRFPLSALLEPPPPGDRPAVTIEVHPEGAPMPAGAVRLDAPLAGLIARPLPTPDERSIVWLAAALGAGFLLYAFGAGVALAGWRRSRRAARQQADFTAAVSHEMKTPIASVRAMAEMLGEDGGEDPALAGRYAGRIVSEMERLGSTVRNVLDTARVERGTLPVSPAPGDPGEVVVRVAETVRPGVEAKGFALEVDVAAAATPALVDATALEGVLTNLVDNALKFSADRRELLLRGGTEPDGGYRIAVLDRGIGIDSDDSERIFARFQRGDAALRGAVPGVGLGLYIARQIIEAHGGRVRARAREGGGAAFEIDLPGVPPR